LYKQAQTKHSSSTSPKSSAAPVVQSVTKRSRLFQLSQIGLFGLDLVSLVITYIVGKFVAADLYILFNPEEFHDPAVQAWAWPGMVWVFLASLLAALAWSSWRANSHYFSRLCQVLALSVLVMLAADRWFRYYNRWNDQATGFLSYLFSPTTLGPGLLILALAMIPVVTNNWRGWLARLADAAQRIRQAHSSPLDDAVWILALCAVFVWAARWLWRPSGYFPNTYVSLRDGWDELLFVIPPREWSALPATLALLLVAMPRRGQRRGTDVTESPLLVARSRLLILGVPLVVGGWLLRRYDDARMVFHLESLPPATFIGVLAALLWLGLVLVRRGRSDGQVREELGAALLGGVLVAVAIFALQVSTDDQRQRAAGRQQVQLTIAARQDLRNYPLAGQNLTGMNLAGKQLDGADLSDSNLIDVDLHDASLTNAKLIRTDLSFASLNGARLIGATLTETRLDNATLTGADFAGAVLCGVNFANFDPSYLRQVKLNKARADEGTTWPSGFDTNRAGIRPTEVVAECGHY
jgi:hypothetical protein